jgi:uncharacterized protein (DUF2249 family)/hemerythrin-like domain-containing protein
MSTVSEAIHNHHQEISSTLREHVEQIVAESAQADPAALVAFLKSDLLPHAAGEERFLYPAVDPLVKAHGSATATMRVDHEFITGYVNQLDETAQALRAASADARPALQATLQRLSLQLEALLLVHLEKEERVYIPLFEEYLPKDEQQRVLDGMHEAPDAAPAANAPDEVLDVRTIPPRGRHELIFATFDALAPGTAFVLVNDHDPKPLFYQFSAEHAGLFSWDYLEKGPETWQVRIARIGQAVAV